MFEVEVRERDVVVVGSDGLMDNLVSPPAFPHVDLTPWDWYDLVISS